MTAQLDLYQQVILEHNKRPKNFGKLEPCTHSAEGFNPLCGDHIWVYLQLSESGVIEAAHFDGAGCAICKASGSMMTVAVKGKDMAGAQLLFREFQQLLVGDLKPEDPGHSLGKLKVFSGIWKYPTRVKCAALAWHTLSSAMCQTGGQAVSTE